MQKDLAGSPRINGPMPRHGCDPAALGRRHQIQSTLTVDCWLAVELAKSPVLRRDDADGGRLTSACCSCCWLNAARRAATNPFGGILFQAPQAFAKTVCKKGQYQSPGPSFDRKINSSRRLSVQIGERASSEGRSYPGQNRQIRRNKLCPGPSRTCSCTGDPEAVQMHACSSFVLAYKLVEGGHSCLSLDCQLSLHISLLDRRPGGPRHVLQRQMQPVATVMLPVWCNEAFRVGCKQFSTPCRNFGVQAGT